MNATQKYRLTPKGILTNIYHKQIERCNKKNLPLPEYSLIELHEMFLKNSLYLELYDKWIMSGRQYYDKPSIDRKDPDKGYAKDNIQIMTWGENREKGDFENAVRFTTAIEMFDRDSNKIREFESIKEAVKETGLHQGLIVMVCQGKRNHTGGYIFRYRGDKFRKHNIHDTPLLKEVTP